MVRCNRSFISNTVKYLTEVIMSLIENEDNPEHMKNLKSYCRFCKRKLSIISIKHSKSKYKINLSQFVATNLIGADINGVEPETVCRGCVKSVEKINKEFRTEEKMQSRIENYSTENNYKNKVLKEKTARQVFNYTYIKLIHKSPLGN